MMPNRSIKASDAKRLSVELEIYEGASAMASAAHAWTYVEQRGGASTPFQSYSVSAACMAAHERRQATPRIIVVKRNGKPTLIVPTVITQLFGFPVVRFLGDPLIQYADILTCESEESDLVRALSAAADPTIACLAVFRRVRDDARIATTLSKMMKQTAVQESPLVNLELPSVLRSRDVREQRRHRRRLAERGEIQVRFTRGSEAKPFLKKALTLKRAWIETYGVQSTVIGCPDWEHAIYDICVADSSQLIAAVLTCGDNLAAVEIAFVNATSWLGFIGAFAPQFASNGPGQILTAECMQWARSNGLLVYDQLPPSQEYKRRHATHSVAVRDYAMALTRLGKLPLAMIKMLPPVKGILADLPDDVRRALLKLSGH